MESIGFLSYAHFDDLNDGGLVTQLALQIASEIRAQSGSDFKLFVDRTNIVWGQTWKTRIEDGIDAASFFFPILTPSYFNSKNCVQEGEQFLQREQALGKSNLILPIYYIQCRGLENALLQNYLRHQYLDWRELRFESLTSPEVRRRIAQVAADVCLAMQEFKQQQQHQGQHSEHYQEYYQEEQQRQAKAEKREINEEQGDLQVKPTTPLRVETAIPSNDFNQESMSELPTIVIESQHAAEPHAISRAIRQAEPGTRILIPPGDYYDTLKVEKSIELIGMGHDSKDVIIHAMDAPAITINTNLCRVSNISFCQAGEMRMSAAVILQGRSNFENCSFSSKRASGIDVRSGDPLISGCLIYNCGEGGVSFEGQSRGVLEDCDIYENYLANVFIFERSNPIIRRCTIHHGHQSGIYIYDHGQGLIEDNDIYNNSHAGIATSTGGNPIVRNNRITRSMHYGGVYVFKGGQGSFENNNVSGNRIGAFQITHKCQQNVRMANNIE